MNDNCTALEPLETDESPATRGGVLVGGEATSVVYGGIMPADFNTFSTAIVTNKSVISLLPPEGVRPAGGTDR